MAGWGGVEPCRRDHAVILAEINQPIPDSINANYRLLIGAVSGVLR